MRAFLVALGGLALAGPAAAEDNGVQASLGYAFLRYVEEGGGSAPVGAFLSVAQAGRRVGIEAELAYHRDTDEFFGESIVVNTFTATAGPRLTLRSGTVRPFLHVLGGARHDRALGDSNTAMGGLAGGGIDIPAGAASVRLGADFEIFFDEGLDVKALRLTAGITF